LILSHELAVAWYFSCLSHHCLNKQGVFLNNMLAFVCFCRIGIWT
jgi:hypothetical protein